VILETEWVLRSLYQFGSDAIGRTLTGVVALSQVQCEDEAPVGLALACMEQGPDLADALHLASSR